MRRNVKQNGESIISYFGKLKKIWQQLDDIDDCTMECASDITKYTVKVNAQRVYVFLAGLDSQLDGVRGRILATKPLPNIQSVYALVCAEANRQGAMLGGVIGEGAAMATKRTIFSKKDRKCTECFGTNHTKDTCFRIHGYPEWHPKGKKTHQDSSSNQDKNANPKVNIATGSEFAAQSGSSHQGEDWQW